MDVSVDTLLNLAAAVKQANGADGTQPVSFKTRAGGTLVLAQVDEEYGHQRFLPTPDDHKSGSVLTLLFENPV